MTNLGLPEWIANSPQEYVAIAKRAAEDAGALSKLRRGMRERMLASPLMQYETFTRNVEAALSAMCERR
jgi:predicted O-linked N-acetylglucosamine transferase (SPINDLY family)